MVERRFFGGLDLRNKTGSITCIMGRNGVGKHLAFKAIIEGLLPIKSGRDHLMKGAALNKQSARKTRLIQALLCASRREYFSYVKR